MRITDLALNDYRSYRELVVQFPVGPVVLRGRNGRGKTNLVEAIAYLSTFSSHRVSADRALVRQGLTGDDDSDLGPGGAVIRARADVGGRSQLLELEIVQGKANRARLNRAKVAPKELLGQVRTVMFAPEDLQLLRGEPGGRRRFLDDILLQLKPSYAVQTRDLEKVLRQRGAVLKQLGKGSGHSDAEIDDNLSAWDQALAALSAQIAVHRLSLVAALAPRLQHHYGVVTGDDKPVRLTYKCDLWSKWTTEIVSRETISEDPELSWPEVQAVSGGYLGDLSAEAVIFEERYLEAMKRHRSAELHRGVNLVGAHRDDFELELQGMPVKGYASQGETWSAVLALRLAQKDVLTADDSTPILILDDVFAELDQLRRQALADSLDAVEQLFITTAVGTDVPETLDAVTYEVDWDSQFGSTVNAVESVDHE